MDIKKTNEITPTEMNCLVYAPSGNGKTTLASTLPLDETLIVSFEGGLLSLRKFDIDYIEIGGSDGVARINFLRKVLPEIMNAKHKNIYFDSLTEIAADFLEVAKVEFPDARQSLPRFGYYNEMITKFLKITRNMKKNVFYTALEKTDKDEVGRRYNLPDLTGSIASKCPAMFDFVFNLRVFEKDGEKVRALLTEAKDGYICKDRSGVLDEYEQPNLQNIINKVFN